MKLSTFLLGIFIFAQSCRSVNQQPVSEVKKALDEMAIPDELLKDLTFDFCPSKKSFSLLNGLWLSYLASAPYTREEILTPKLNELGFGSSSAKSIVYLNGRSKSKFFAPTSQALYAEHSTLDFAVISFRGSEADEVSDLSTDLNLLHRPFESLGKVHSGFHAAYEELAAEVFELLKTKSEAKPIRLWLTGHSLGGAIATLFTVKILLMKQNGELPNVELVGLNTIGSPRVGNPTFARLFDELTQRNQVTSVRIRNRADPVTMLPIGLYGEGGYWHIGAFAYLGANQKLYHNDDPRVILEDSDYNRSKTPRFNDHLLRAYFAGMKQAYLENLGTERSDCRIVGDNLPPKPFHENPADRDKAQAQDKI